MNHILLAGLFAAFVSTAAFAQPGPLDQTPSPTIVYCDQDNAGCAPVCDVAGRIPVSFTQ